MNTLSEVWVLHDLVTLLVYSSYPFLSQCRSEEANKAFSAAVQMHDVLVKAWAMWGDYLENIFVKERQLHLGVSAITCYLHACRHQNESKSRKYLAKVRLRYFKIIGAPLPGKKLELCSYAQVCLIRVISFTDWKL